MRLTEVKRADNGEFKYRRFTHRVSLPDFCGDTPAIKHLSRCQDHGAHLGCPFCVLRGISGKGGGMYWDGWRTETTAGTASVHVLLHADMSTYVALEQVNVGCIRRRRQTLLTLPSACNAETTAPRLGRLVMSASTAAMHSTLILATNSESASLMSPNFSATRFLMTCNVLSFASTTVACAA